MGFYNNGFDGFTGAYGGGGGDCAGPGYSGGFGGPGFGMSAGYGGMGSRGNRGYGMGMMGRGGFGARGGKRPFVGGMINRGSAYDSQTGHSVHMRGLPYSATEEDIAQVDISNTYSN
jgi:heterogeneous nuclear ribonucleoprotein F/H